MKKTTTATTESPAWWAMAQTDTHAWVMDVDFSGANCTRKVLLLADIHWDNAHCRLDLLKATLDEAKAIGAPVFSFGDHFCAMQGKWDRRASAEALRDEHRGGNYLDLLVNTCADWFAPYASSLAMISPGNHETAIRRHHQVDLTQQLVSHLRREGSPVVAGPYWGFVVLSCNFNGDRKRSSEAIKLHYHHGYGGGGPISRGLIDHSRTRSDYDSDVHVTGHIHRRNADENVITRVSNRGKIFQQPQLFLRCSTWKDESQDGYHVEQGRASRPIGGWWLELTSAKTREHRNSTYHVRMRAVPT
jgi:hypothetical protein